MKNKEELLQEGYELLGKYNEELLTYFKMDVVKDVPGVSYCFVDKQGNITGGKKFFSKRDLGLAVNIQEKIASKQRSLFESKGKKPGKRYKKHAAAPAGRKIGKKP